jgi:hypothetical protein
MNELRNSMKENRMFVKDEDKYENNDVKKIGKVNKKKG